MTIRLFPCGTPLCAPCGGGEEATCDVRIEINSAAIYNPGLLSLDVSNVGNPVGNVPADTNDRNYYLDGTELLVLSPDTTFLGPSTAPLHTTGLAQVNFPSTPARYVGSSAPSDVLGIEFVLTIPYTGVGTPPLTDSIFHEVTSDGLTLRMRVTALNVVADRLRVTIRLEAGMDTWPDDSTYFYKFLDTDSVYFDGGLNEFVNTLRTAIGDAEPCGGQTVQEPLIYFGASVEIIPGDPSPYRFELYSPRVDLAVPPAPPIDVDAILATGGVVRVNGFDLTIGTTLLSTMADGLVVANTEPTNWTVILVATNIASGEDYRIASDPDGENLVLVAAGDTPDLMILGTTSGLPALPVVAGVSQVDAGAVVARVNSTELTGFGPTGSAVPGVGSADYVLAGSGGSGQMAFIIIPSALTAEELDAIHAATVFP